VADLTKRYRFREQYAAQADQRNPQAIVQTLVGVVETIKTETENPRGAPDRRQLVAQTIYNERPAELSPEGTVVCVVRHYKNFRLKPPDPTAKPGDRPPLEGLDVWYQVQQRSDALVLSLTRDRPLREIELTIIGRQVFFPALTALLPPQPSRLGDHWSVPRPALRSLLGPQAAPDDRLTATFKDLRTTGNGDELVATIHVTAQATPFQAELQFVFPKDSPPVDDSQGSTIDARGALTEIRCAQVSTSPLPESNGRLRQIQTRELIAARKRADGRDALLDLPEPRPTPTPENSWVTYVDPHRRFHFRHPQTFVNDSLPGADSVELIRQRPEGPDVIGVQLQPKTGDAAADRRNIDPDFVRRELEERWRLDRLDFVAGANEWLDKNEWNPLRVYRIEAALKVAPAGAPAVERRIHYDYYLVLSQRDESFVVNATTVQDNPGAFRKEAEDMIKTLRFGMPEK
jgi:hypothetical protein